MPSPIRIFATADDVEHAFYDAIARAEAESYIGLLGPLEYVESKEVIDGVNLRIVLGNDFAAALGAGIGATTTTVEQ